MGKQIANYGIGGHFDPHADQKVNATYVLNILAILSTTSFLALLVFWSAICRRPRGENRHLDELCKHQTLQSRILSLALTLLVPAASAWDRRRHRVRVSRPQGESCQPYIGLLVQPQQEPRRRDKSYPWRMSSSGRLEMGQQSLVSSKWPDVFQTLPIEVGKMK